MSHSYIYVAPHREQEQINAVASLGEVEIQRCRELTLEIERLQEQQRKGSIGLAELGSTFRRMRTERSTEYKALRVFDVAVALAMPLAKRELANWKPLENPKEGLDALEPWRDLASGERVEVVNLLSEGALMPSPHLLNPYRWPPRPRVGSTNMDLNIRLGTYL